jgi:hypothetical protein
VYSDAKEVGSVYVLRSWRIQEFEPDLVGGAGQVWSFIGPQRLSGSPDLARHVSHWRTRAAGAVTSAVTAPHVT